jgi:cytochrome c553
MRAGPKRALARSRTWRVIFAVLAALAVLDVRSAAAGPSQDYMLYCMGCHGAQAQGVPGKVPPLAHSLGRFMRRLEGRDYVLRVPGAANSVLSDAQLAAVLNWLAARFDAPALDADVPWFTAAEVARSRRVPLASVGEARRAVLQALAAGGAAPAADY